MTVNGVEREVRAAPMKRLLDVLREDLALTGTKEGCGEGECGSCSVRMNGELVNSCLVPVLQADGARVETVEGLANQGKLHPLQQAFLSVRRRAVRHLHAGHADGRDPFAGPQSAPHYGGDPGRTFRQSLSMYRIHPHLRIGDRRRLAIGAPGSPAIGLRRWGGESKHAR